MATKIKCWMANSAASTAASRLKVRPPPPPPPPPSVVVMSHPSRPRIIRLFQPQFAGWLLLCGLFFATLQLLPAVVWSFAPAIGVVFTSSQRRQRPRAAASTLLHQSTFTADGSEYSADKSDFDSSDDEYIEGWNTPPSGSLNNEDDDDDTPTIELQPVPMSKNAGNRFVAVIWDRDLQKDKSKDALDLHYDRIALTEEHVMFCRKQNLYNETFNTESMVDILWSLPMYVGLFFRVLACVYACVVCGIEMT